ncbi:MAG: ATP-binding cassette domain-containing protein [Chthoniobacteraceae bacterium]
MAKPTGMKVELAGITKVYGGIRALNEVRLEFSPGRIVAVVGLNGAGKSTLLQAMAGLLAFKKGDVYYDDEPFTRDRVDFRKRLAFLPDFPVAYTHMTVLEHIAMVLHLYEKDGPGAEERVLDLLRAFSMVPLARAPMGALSRGQLYKAALIALIAAAPELWLLDEPMASGMDALGLREFEKSARTAAARGATIIYTTQILSVAQRFSDEVVVLNQGRVHTHETTRKIEAEGNLEELFEALKE